MLNVRSLLRNKRFSKTTSVLRKLSKHINSYFYNNDINEHKKLILCTKVKNLSLYTFTKIITYQMFKDIFNISKTVVFK